jgi:hypothetical protein
MPRAAANGRVSLGFEETSRRISISEIQPLHEVTTNIKKSAKYRQIAASIREVGIIEPPVLARPRKEGGKYLLLDGHLRIETLKDMGQTEVTCLISTDDEAFTYNKRVNRLAIIQEHRMIMRAIERGASEERIAKTLNLDVSTIRHKRRLLDGICLEAVELLKDKHVPMNAFTELRRLVPIRQIEAAELMVALNKYTTNYVRSLVAATPQSQLAAPTRPKTCRGLTAEQMSMMERESANLDREFKLAEQSYGANHLDLVLAKGYLTKLLGNVRIVRYLAQNCSEFLTEFQKIAELETTAV